MLTVIMDRTRDPASSLALDEALLRADGPIPLLRLWQTHPCVVIGRFQDPATAVDLDACAHADLPVLRRATGGTAVVLGPACLNMTLVDERAAETAAQALRAVNALLAELTAALGLLPPRAAALTTRNRILVHASIQTPPAGGNAGVVDALRAAIIAAVVDQYGAAVTRGLTDAEVAYCEDLLARRYGTIGWHRGSSRHGLVRVA